MPFTKKKNKKSAPSILKTSYDLKKINTTNDIPNCVIASYYTLETLLKEIPLINTTV